MDNVDNKIKFFSVCVDNFFSNPNLIRNWALKLSYSSDNDGRWPGKRTESLHKLNKDFANILILKIFSTYYNLNIEKIKWKDSHLYFQLIKKFSDDQNSLKNIGWIHQDIDSGLAGVIYLTPNINLESGTSLFNIKENVKIESIDKLQLQKHLLYKNYDIDETEYSKCLLNNNNNFQEKTNFKNIYNRMICYDAKEFHRANNFFDKNFDRLTLVFFINDIEVSTFYPNDRLKNHNFDLSLETLIKNCKFNN